MRVIATPGHTAHHLAYHFEDARGDGASQSFVCTGGSLLAGTTGRTDLLGADRAGPLARDQWSSVRRLLTELAGSTVVLPTHGFGSFCSATPSQGGADAQSTISGERKRNPAATEEVEEFVLRVTVDPPPIPGHYRYMGPLNRAGQPEPRTELSEASSADAVEDILAAGAGSSTCALAVASPRCTASAR